MPLELTKRSHLSRGGRFGVGVALALLGVGAMVAEIEPKWMSWVFLSIAVLGIMVLSFWKSEDKEELAEEDIIEVTKNAIRAEAERMDSKRLKLENVLMAYGELMEYPDFDSLQKEEWATVEKTIEDKMVADMLDAEADAMLARFSQGVYWEDKKFRARPLLLDLYSYIEKISKVYRPESERPLLETNLESIFKAINRASLQVILLLEELPLIDVKELNLKKISDRVRKASQVYRKYEELSPYLEPVRYLWQGSKLLLASNPLLAAGWIAGSELFWKGGKKYGKKTIDAYLLSLVRQMLGIITWETAGIFDRTYRYRNPDWIYALELAHLVSVVEFSNKTVRASLKELGSLPLKSTYDRIFLYRCVAQHVSPKPERFAQPDLMTDDVRAEILLRLKKFFSNEVEEATAKQIETWQKGVEKRLVIDRAG